MYDDDDDDDDEINSVNHSSHTVWTITHSQIVIVYCTLSITLI